VLLHAFTKFSSVKPPPLELLTLRHSTSLSLKHFELFANVRIVASLTAGNTVTMVPSIELSLLLFNCQFPFNEKIPPLVFVGRFVSVSQPVIERAIINENAKIFLFMICFL